MISKWGNACPYARNPKWCLVAKLRWWWYHLSCTFVSSMHWNVIVQTHLHPSSSVLHQLPASLRMGAEEMWWTRILYSITWIGCYDRESARCFKKKIKKLQWSGTAPAHYKGKNGFSFCKDLKTSHRHKSSLGRALIVEKARQRSGIIQINMWNVVFGACCLKLWIIALWYIKILSIKSRATSILKSCLEMIYCFHFGKVFNHHTLFHTFPC